MNTLQFIIPWMAHRRPASFNRQSVASFAQEVADVVVNVDVFPPPGEPWSAQSSPTEHATAIVGDEPYCKVGIFWERRTVGVGEAFGVIDLRTLPDYQIFSGYVKVRTRFSPSRRLALWRDAVRQAFPDLGGDDQGLLAAHLCHAHIKAAYRTKHRWVRPARVSIGMRADYTTSIIKVKENDFAVPHHLLWEEALDEVIRFAAKQAEEFCAGFSPSCDSEEELLDALRALSRRIVEEYGIGTSYVRDNPHLFDIAVSFDELDMQDLPQDISIEILESLMSDDADTIRNINIEDDKDHDDDDDGGTSPDIPFNPS